MKKFLVLGMVLLLGVFGTVGVSSASTSATAKDDKGVFKAFFDSSGDGEVSIMHKVWVSGATNMYISGSSIVSYGTSQAAQPIEIIGASNYLTKNGNFMDASANRQAYSNLASASTSTNHDAGEDYHSESYHSFTHDGVTKNGWSFDGNAFW